MDHTGTSTPSAHLDHVVAARYRNAIARQVWTRLMVIIKSFIIYGIVGLCHLNFMLTVSNNFHVLLQQRGLHMTTFLDESSSYMKFFC